MNKKPNIVLVITDDQGYPPWNAAVILSLKRPIWDERFLATDTQRIAHPIKRRKSCVMQNKWRLVNRHELYVIEADHPELVSRMQDAYEDWWDLCAAQFDDDVPISIGSVKEKRVIRYGKALKGTA